MGPKAHPKNKKPLGGLLGLHSWAPRAHPDATTPATRPHSSSRSHPRGRAFYRNPARGGNRLWVSLRAARTACAPNLYRQVAVKLPAWGRASALSRKTPPLSLPQPSARYLQVKHFVLEQVAAGTLRAGERVPSENDLVRELRVSRMTANRALKELAADGVLVRVAGVGTFVAEQRVHAHPLEVRNIADEIRARGHEYRVRVVALECVPASRELAERFEVKTGAALDYSLLTHFE